MKRHGLTTGVLILLPVLLIACDRSAPEAPPPEPLATAESPATTSATSTTDTTQTTGPDDAGILELDWDALIPDDWRVDKLMDEYNADNLDDEDPRAQELMEKLKAFWNSTTVVRDYDGRLVKLPGFVVPLEMDATTIDEFLLVPYYGACIHVPPPPANQTVHVVTGENRAYHGKLFDTVWVTGTLTVEATSSDLGEAGYRIDAATVEPYQ